jgi:hypothetical protein
MSEGRAERSMSAAGGLKSYAKVADSPVEFQLLTPGLRRRPIERPEDRAASGEHPLLSASPDGTHAFGFASSNGSRRDILRNQDRRPTLRRVANS